MHPEQKTLLTSALEALGPERVTRGLEATGHTWNDCFLAIALCGAPAALARQLQKRWRREHFVGTLLGVRMRSEEHTSELQSRLHLVCRLLLEKKKKQSSSTVTAP